MAQWIRKTAWKACNLNKRYGTPYMSTGYAQLDPQSNLAAYASLQSSVSAEAVRKAVIAASGAVVIDVRTAVEQRRNPLTGAAVVDLHPHDILSGAAGPVLPRDKSRAEIFVLASEPQRAANACAALRRWGYANASAVSVSTVAELLGEMTAPEAAASETS